MLRCIIIFQTSKMSNSVVFSTGQNIPERKSRHVLFSKIKDTSFEALEASRCLTNRQGKKEENRINKRQVDLYGLWFKKIACYRQNKKR